MFWSVIDDLKDIEARVRIKRDERIVGDGDHDNDDDNDDRDRPGPSRKRKSEDTLRFIRNLVSKWETCASKLTYLMRVGSLRLLD
jgi:hypothetical protein